MRKTIETNSRKLFVIIIGSASILTIACNNSPDAKVGTLYRDSPTPAPTIVADASPQPSAPLSPVGSPSPAVSPTPENSPNESASPSPEPTIPADDPFVNKNQTDPATGTTSTDKLMIPVVGVRGENLRDTFDDARSEGRVHDAIDIMAAGGTPVVAATNGKIIKFFDSVKGGITIYQLSPDERTVYYYAHLERRADGLSEGAFAKQGDLLGYVGDTGNAGAGNFHLHFAIWTITDPKHFYDGVNLNPYPLLKDGIVKTQQ